jgi:dTMP kinase
VSPPLFISFEGIDGSGKSTQIKALKRFLREQGRSVEVVREPGSTKLGEKVREILLGESDIVARAEASLFAAARAQLVETVVRPALAKGRDVLCDRYVDSSLAYQGVGRQLDFERLYEWNKFMVEGLMPDRTFLLELPAEDVSLRLTRQLRLFDDDECVALDRLESESLSFKRAVQDGYTRVAEMFADRVEVLNASRGVDEVSRAIRQSVFALLRERQRAAAVRS